MFIWANVEVNFGVIAGQFRIGLVFISYANLGVPQLVHLCYGRCFRCTESVIYWAN